MNFFAWVRTRHSYSLHFLFLLFLTLPFSVQMKIVIELKKPHQEGSESPVFSSNLQPAPSWKGEGWFGKSSSTKRKDLYPRKCCTGWYSQCSQQKGSLNLPWIFGLCLFQVFTASNSCFSLVLNVLVLKLKWQCQVASPSIENTKSNPSALIMKLPPLF